MSKENFRQWIFGMLINELDISSTDEKTLLKLNKCTHEIMGFADEVNLFVKESIPQENENSGETQSGEAENF